MRRARNPYYKREKGHHTPDGFKNNFRHGHYGPLTTLKWMIKGAPQRYMNRWRAKVEGVRPDVEFLRGNRERTTVTWLGHATVLLQTAGLNILFDPLFKGRASPLFFYGPKRHQPPPIALDELPEIDAVVISHNHYDHLSLPVVRRLYRRRGSATRFYLPLGVERWFARYVSGGEEGRLVALDWWEKVELGGVELGFLPTQHWSVRTLWDRNRTLWGAWSVRQPEFAFFFSGDLGYSGDTAEIGLREGGFDLSAISIGSYEARWFMRAHHINPAEAVKVHREIGSKRSFGIHWGTLEGISDEALDLPPRELAEACRAAGLGEGEFTAPLPGSMMVVGE